MGDSRPVFSRTLTTPSGALSNLLSGNVAATAPLTSPRSANALGRKTIRKTNRFRALNVDHGDAGTPSLYGGPVSPEQITPRTASSLLAEMQMQAKEAAPHPDSPTISLEGIMLPPSPTMTTVTSPTRGPNTPVVTTKPTNPSPSRHIRQTSVGGSDLTRNTTMFVQKLQELCGGAHQDVSLMTLGNIRAITAVQDCVWVAHNNPAPNGQKSPPSIAVYNRDSLIQKPEVMLPEVTVNNMIFVGRQVWLASSSKDLICINPVDPLFQHMLKGHSGAITDLACMGKTIWTIGSDQMIGVWDVATMKLRKMMKGSVMNCIIHVAGVAWVGTVRGIQRYSTENLKQIKEYAAIGDSAQYLKMAVSKLLLVNNYVWAVHHDENMISVWDAENKMFITAFEAIDVVGLLHIGTQVWMTSHNSVIRCYDITTFQKIGELTGMHQDWVTCMTVARHKDSLRVWSGSTDATICLWDACVRPHDFISESSRPGNCEVCKKTLKSFGGKILRCRNCQKFAIHVKCRDLLPCGCTCSGGIERSMVASAAKI